MADTDKTTPVASDATPVASDAGTENALEDGESGTAEPASEGSTPAEGSTAETDIVRSTSGPPQAGTIDSQAGTIDSPAEGVPPRARRVLVALLALVLVSAVVVGWVGWRAYSSGQDRGARDEALAAARSDTAQVLSYSAPTLDADLARSRSMISGAFSAKFAQLADKVIVPAAKQQGLSTKATVVRAAVIDAQPDQVRTLLFVNQNSTTTAMPTPTAAANQVRVTMTSVDGQWLISDLQPL